MGLLKHPRRLQYTHAHDARARTDGGELMTSYAIQRGQDMTNYAGLITRSVLGGLDIPPLYGIEGLTSARFEAWDAESELLIVGMFSCDVTPVKVEVVKNWAWRNSDYEDTWTGALIVPPTVELTDDGRIMCGAIAVYQCFVNGKEIGVRRIE